MSAAAARVAAPPAVLPPNEAVYRDDGPLARALGRPLPVPALALLLAGVGVLVAAIAIAGGDASPALAGAVLAFVIVTVGVTSRHWPRASLHWAVPPLVRLAEYAGLVWIAAIAGGSAPAGAFALLAALAFRHYDLVYGLRHRAELPPPWLNALAAGWDGRLVIAWLLLVAGALPAGLFVWAGLLAAASLAATVTAWRHFERGRRPAEYDDPEDEGG
jgi:Family of unknown function (DUF5941)